MKKSLVLLLLIGLWTSSGVSQSIDMELFHGMKPRNIGPAGMSGRVTSIAVELRDKDNIYIGTAAGGIWKSQNAGHTWTPIFDDQIAASIGDIAIFQKNPDIIYAGSGEGNPRNSQNSGMGMFKSIDGGDSWIHLGLEETRQIHRVLVHPENSDVVVVGVSGATWGDSDHRGVYRTEDGGKTWHKVLYIDERTGISDLIVHPDNPDVLLAAMWEHRRWPWYFKSGGKGSGLHRSHDGGKTWRQITTADGLPKGDLGRMGLTFSPVNPDKVYAYIESKDNAIYGSEDGGKTWSRRSKSKDRLIGDRPFYYADIYADSKNENRLYSIASTVTVSEDGGRTWKMFAPGNKIHTDHHAFWMHPDDPDFIMIGHDGGLNITHDRGENWWFAENLPLGQFYHLRVDNEFPYNVMGGLQDNGSWLGPSQTWFKGGIRNMYWQRLSVGDGFDVVPDPLDPDFGYAMGQAGNLVRYHRPTGQLTPIRPIHPEGDYLRFNWNAGIGINPIDQKTIYYGSQYLHKSSDHGESWEIISPDLTTDDQEKQKFLRSGGLTYDVTGAEFHTTIISIDPSPIDDQIIWVGTDDGQVQVTSDGGSSWTEVNTKMPGVPENTWVPQLNASTYHKSEAFVVFDDHRRNNWTPYLYRTRDLGKTWERIVDEDDVEGYVYCHEQDPTAPNLHFVGTEFGLYVSFDDAANWHRWSVEYPTVPTSDLVVHSRDLDLVIATFGRSFWILDDIRPLQEIATVGPDKIFEKPLHVFKVPPAYATVIGESKGYRHGKIGDALYNGENRKYGALISFYLKEVYESGDSEDLKDKVKIEVRDEDNSLVRTLYQAPKEGINRVQWALSKDRLRFPNQAKPKKVSPPQRGALVLPGTYTVVITYKDHRVESNAVVHKDPRIQLSDIDIRHKSLLIASLEDEIAHATTLMDDIRNIRDGMELTEALVKQNEVSKEDIIHVQLDSLESQLEQIDILLEGEQVQGIYRDPNSLMSQFFLAGNLIFKPLQKSTSNQEVLSNQIKARVDNFESVIGKLKTTSLMELKDSVKRLGLQPFNN